MPVAYIAPLLEGSSLANAGVWADTIRDDPAWAHTRPWHFINVGDDEPLSRAMRNPQGNVLTAIEQSERDLVNQALPRERRAVALRFLVHFVADVHQPLHVGRAEDRGGNDIEVRWGEDRLTLHEFWDARGLLESEGLRPKDLGRADRRPGDWRGSTLAGRPRHWTGPRSPGPCGHSSMTCPGPSPACA